jgi:hypothetical protein
VRGLSLLASSSRSFAWGLESLVPLVGLVRGDTVMRGLKGGLSGMQFARLLSRPLLWLTGSSHVELMSPAMREA